LQFLKLKQKNKAIVPSLEIEIAWQSYLLRPMKYRSFCLENFQKIIDHSFSFLNPSDKDLEITENLWKSQYKTPFHIKGEDTPFDDKDLKGLALWIWQDQKWIQYFHEELKNQQVTVINDEFLLELVQLYIKFLDVVKNNPQCDHYLHPSVLIDIMWHVHMLHPLTYANTCKSYTNLIIDHEPWPSNDLDKDTAKTDELWTKKYQTPMKESIPLYFKIPITIRTNIGLWNNLLTQFFMFMTPYETLKMGLVCKQWRELSRLDYVHYRTPPWRLNMLKSTVVKLHPLAY